MQSIDLTSVPSVQSQLGKVYIVNQEQQAPIGYRKLKHYQSQQIKNQLLSIIPQWTAIALEDGKITGKGYGGIIAQSNDNSQCEKMFIVSLNSTQYGKSDAGYQKNSDTSVQKLQDYNNNFSHYAHVKTPLGLVLKISLNQQIPYGFRKMTLQEGKEVKEYLNQLLQTWSIVAFQHGKIDGYGYGNNFQESYGSECGEVFVISVAPM